MEESTKGTFSLMDSESQIGENKWVERTTSPVSYGWEECYSSITIF